MFFRSFVPKSFVFLPNIVPVRSKVRILPKEVFDDYETPFMKSRNLPGKSSITDFYALAHRKDLNLTLFRNWRKWKAVEEMRKDQTFMPARHKALGPDLATAHFITKRGGRVRFKDHNAWVTYDHITKEDVPSVFDPAFLVEEVDASEMNLCYEGIQNLSSLREFKKLILRRCPNIDDWCLHRFHLFEHTLEYLDLSGCENITERGICSLHVLKNLKTLVIHDTPNIQHKELVSVLLQDIQPRLDVIGVDLEDPTLKKRLENYID